MISDKSGKHLGVSQTFSEKSKEITDFFQTGQTDCLLCINAFYQVENIINYYFYTTYPDINELLSIIEDYTRQEKSEKFQYKRSGKEKNVSDIQIANKIDAYCNIFFNGDKFKMTLGQLRQVRNEGEHRCMIIQQEKDETNSLYKFFKYNTFNSVRIALIKLVNSIKENIGQRLE